MPPAECFLHLSDKNIDFHPLVQDWYEGAPAVVTANICLPLGAGKGTTVRAVRILLPETVTFTPIEISWRAAASPSSWPATCRGASYSRSETARDQALTFRRLLRLVSLYAPADPGAFRHPAKPSIIHHHVRRICPQPRCGMTGKEQHFRPPHSLTSTKCCCNSRSTSPLARIVLAEHKIQRKTMDRAFVTGLYRVTLQWVYVVLSRARLPRAHPIVSARILP